MLFAGRDTPLVTARLVNPAEATSMSEEPDARVKDKRPAPVRLPPVKVAVPSVNVPPLIMSVAVRESDNDARTPVRLPVMLVVPNVAEVICP